MKNRLFKIKDINVREIENYSSLASKLKTIKFSKINLCDRCPNLIKEFELYKPFMVQSEALLSDLICPHDK